MRRLMALTARLGHDVTGSDLALGPHSAAAVAGADIAVYTAAIGDDNVELVAARRAGIPTVERAEYLAVIASGYDRVIAVSGTHGKTTATAMLASVMAAKRPTVHLGGELVSPPAEEKREYFLTEACEYRRSFLALRPDIGVILNAELDHTDCYRSLGDVIEAFAAFADGSRLAVYNGDDAGLAAIGRENAVTFGRNGGNDFRAVEIETDSLGRPSFGLTIKGLYMGRLFVNAIGEHQVYNALAAATVALIEGMGFSEVRAGLNAYRGVKRRAEFCGRAFGADVYTDYAHHPTEIRATLAALRPKSGPLVAAFEPHTFSRTVDLMDGFATCFSRADETAVLPVFASRERGDDARREECSRELCDRINARSPAFFCPSYGELIARLRDMPIAGGRVVFLGAGTIDEAARAFVSAAGSNGPLSPDK